MENKEVLIHVRGFQTVIEDGEEQPVEIVVPGEYYFRNGSHYLRYEEMMEEFSEPTINYVKMSERGMEVRKKGSINTHMVFEQGKKTTVMYTTPFGTLQMGISAISMELSESENSINMRVNYALDMNEGHVADCFLDIQAQSKNAEEFTL